MDYSTARKNIKHTRRLPPWMKRKIVESRKVVALKKKLKEKGLHTVCQSAGCPNISECFEKPTATFMIMGDVCTRNCSFCGVATGEPGPLDKTEPGHVAEVVKDLGLKHVVLTSVTRDDLVDGGSEHFYHTINAIKEMSPHVTVEALIPDFQGSISSLERVLSAGLDILNHNVETVPRLYSRVRPQADFQQSCSVLENAKKIMPEIMVKSGLMVGLGETPGEMNDVFRMLAGSGCDIMTVGQYLAPSTHHYPVAEYVTPEQFDRYAVSARESGIRWVASGPYVRSSYNAEELMRQIREEM